MQVLLSELNTLLKVLKKKELTFLILYFVSGLMWSFYKKPFGNYTIKLSSFKFTMPLYHPINWMLSEIFIYEVLGHIKGCQKVLDLGGFIGESALYLSNRNEHVDVYELDPGHYKYLQKNIQQSNIQGYPYGVGLKNEIVYFSKKGDFDPSLSMTGEVTDYKGNIKSITDINIGQYDGVKIDIEGAEYQILPYLIEHNFFQIQQGFIEFHLTGGNDKIQKKAFNEFLVYLKDNNFTYRFINNYAQKIARNIFVRDKFISVCFKR